MLLALFAAASLAACRVDHARYVLRTAPEVTAEFRPVGASREWPSGLALKVHFAKSGRSYWFLPWDGGTSDLQHLASTTDVAASGWRPPSPDGGPRPIGDIDYIATDASYRVIDATPRPGGPAPAHLLFPNLGDATWHSNYDGAPKQFFDLVGC
ncbi:MAG TPA: hypothetical protein VFW13_01060 [Phenylobacterium sp.]|nr:hypothetical protein [Phenylobacterium sp.]